MKMSDIAIARKMVRKENDAKNRGIEFDMTFAAFKNLMNAKVCYYTKLPLTDGSEVISEPTKRTIDRKDHTKGYVKGNVVACCHAFNQLKNELEKTGAIGEITFQRAVAKAFTDINTIRGSKKRVVVK